MKFAALLVALLAVSACAKPAEPEFVTAMHKDGAVMGPELSLCSPCTQFVSQSFQQLINIILNSGVLGTCGALCGQLANPTEATICELGCAVVGIDAFMKLLDDISGDIDPIYFCEVVHMCPIVNGGAMNINSVTMSPDNAPQNTQFTMTIDYTVVNATGTTDIEVFITDGMTQAGASDMNIGQTPGDYTYTVQFQAHSHNHVDFQPGNYTAEIDFCEGTCGSPYKHSGLYASGETDFVLTPNPGHDDDDYFDDDTFGSDDDAFPSMDDDQTM